MITIITVGKIKEKYIREGIDEYLKRLTKYAKIELIELDDECFDKEKTLKKEAEKIEKKLNKTLELEVQVDPSLIAGIKVQASDLVMDNTLVAKINAMKEAINR